MKQWEYKTVMTISKGLFLSPTREFNKLGLEGWEAVGISHHTDGLLITLFKREI